VQKRRNKEIARRTLSFETTNVEVFTFDMGGLESRAHKKSGKVTVLIKAEFEFNAYKHSHGTYNQPSYLLNVFIN